MKKTFQLNKTLMAVVLASSSTMLLVPTISQAGVSANVGMVSNYVFRGVDQSDGKASASAGLDYENDSGIYVGTWVGGVDNGAASGAGKGLEYDFYAGWSGEVKGVSLGLGGTYFGYTEASFDQPYKEVNLSVGFAGVTLGYDKGVHELATEADYSHTYISYERNNFSATYAVYDANIDANNDAVNYLDLGYSIELAKGLDGSVNYIYSAPEDSANDPKTYLILGISKSFDVM
ncbi:MAG: TorF family putative porin [Thiomicrorhabdus sp.]|nr:TorF family putative porin [Thiomicrorhabdus sp.]